MRCYSATILTGVAQQDARAKTPIGVSREMGNLDNAAYLVESRQDRAEIFDSGVSYAATPAESFMESNTQF